MDETDNESNGSWDETDIDDITYEPEEICSGIKNLLFQ